MNRTIVAAIFLFIPAALHAQELQSSGDSAQAMALLREQLARDLESPRLKGDLGTLLAARASAREDAFLERAEAEDLLRDALARDTDNPRYLAALGVLLQKKGMTNDATRVLSRALDEAAKNPLGIEQSLVADALFYRGKVLEVGVQEFENFRMTNSSSVPVITESCSDLGVFCLNYTRPRYFYESLASAPNASGVVAEKREEMIADYRRALQVAPDHELALRGLVAAYARSGQWTEYNQLAQAFVDRAPENAWAAVFLAAGDYWEGRHARADSLFRASIPRLSESDRIWFEDLSPILPPASHSGWQGSTAASREMIRARYWHQQEALFLTPYNEREAEHYARVALAELLFGEPQSGRRGWRTDRGEIMVRYGRPKDVIQIVRDDAIATAGDRLGGGRWIFWNYDPVSPSFIFQKALGRASVAHMKLSLSQNVADDMKVSRPSVYAPPFTRAGEVNYQLTSFRGATRDRYEVEIHAQLPESLAKTSGDSVIAGLFLFPRGGTVRTVDRRVRRKLLDGAASFNLDLPDGNYEFAVEGATTDLSRTAVARGEFVVRSMSRGSLQLSDLLLVSRLDEPASDPKSREDLAYEPLRCIQYPDNGRLGLVFEIYGLQSQDGEFRYRVQLDAGEAPAGSLAMRLSRGVRNLIYGESGAEFSFDKSVRAEGDRVLEWFELDLPGEKPISRDLVLTISDLSTSRTATVRRHLPVTGCGS